MKSGSVKKKRQRSDPYANVVVLRTNYKYRGLSSRTKIFHCEYCGGQLFVLCMNGNVVCHVCRKKNHNMEFKTR